MQGPVASTRWRWALLQVLLPPQPHLLLPPCSPGPPTPGLPLLDHAPNLPLLQPLNAKPPHPHGRFISAPTVATLSPPINQTTRLTGWLSPKTDSASPSIMFSALWERCSAWVGRCCLLAFHPSVRKAIKFPALCLLFQPLFC